jgi:hydroxylamine reductase (hybrid-cluster protein)
VKVAETVYRENWWNEEEKLFHELPEHIILEINSTIDIVYEDIQNKISIKKKELLDRYTEEERILNSQ